MRCKLKNNMQEIIKEQRSEISKIRKRDLTFPVLFNGTKFTFTDSSVAELTLYLSVTNSGLPLPDGFGWMDDGNDFLEMDADSFVLFAKEVMSARWLRWRESWDKKSKLNVK